MTTTYYKSACNKIKKNKHKEVLIDLYKPTVTGYTLKVLTQLVKNFIDNDYESNKKKNRDKKKEAFDRFTNYLILKIREDEPDFDHDKLIERARSGEYTKKRKRNKNETSINNSSFDLYDQYAEHITYNDNYSDISNQNKIKKEIKRYERKKVSTGVKEILLERQDYCCRGPSEKTNVKYVCPLKRNKQKGSLRTKVGLLEANDIDHILELENGGNNEIINLQVLCRSCHYLKTQLAKLFKNDSSLKKELIDVYKSFCKPKC